MGIKEWLWVFTHPNFCLFRAGDTRCRTEVSEQLGQQYPGIIISDDLNVYNGYPVVGQQKCLAHLRRHAQKLIKAPGKHNQSIGEELTELIDEAFKHHRLQKTETLCSKDYFDWAAQFKTKVQSTLARWSKKAGYEAGKLLRNLKLKADQWWYFLDHPEIPPDNNLAERAFSFGSHQTKRSVVVLVQRLRFQETANLLSVIQTCRFQSRSVMDFFQQALMATIGIADRPSLIPQFHT